MLSADTKPIERIIWSGDMGDETALLVALESMPELRYVKLDRMFIEGAGFDVIDRVAELGVKVFDDAKIIEIPSKMVGIAQNHLAHAPWMLNCMAGGVSSMVLENDDLNKVDGLKRFADACHAAGTLPCAVTVLTSKTPEVVGREFGQTSEDQVLEYVGMLLDCGFTDVVCSPKEVSIIRADARFDEINLNTPGIRFVGADQGDQARADTPQGSLAAGSDRLIIGRPITVGIPAENLANIVASISY